jgi:hypothetical protein
MKDEASHLSIGSEQQYIEDCRPNIIHVEVDEKRDVQVWA